MPHLSAISNRIRRRPVSSFRGNKSVGGEPAPPVTDGVDLTPAVNVSIPAHHSLVVARTYKVASGNFVALASGAILRIL